MDYNQKSTRRSGTKTETVYNTYEFELITYPIEKNDLKLWNIVLGIVHSISFIIILILTIIYELPKYNITTDFYKYDQLLNRFDIKLDIISYYNPAWVLLPFPLITSIFHISLGTFLYDIYQYNLFYKGIQYYRWIEYSITAGLMTWVIWTLSGGSNLFLGLSLLILNINMNIFGLTSEVLNATNLNDKKIKKVEGYQRNKKYHKLKKTETTNTNPEKGEEKLIALEKQNEKEEKEENKDLLLKDWYEKLYFKDFDKNDHVTWWPIMMGFLNFIIIWTILLTYFFEAVASKKENIPWFVWTIDIGLLFQFLSFGLIMTMHYYYKQNIIDRIICKPDTKFEIYKKNNYFAIIFANRYYNELSYQLLSITSKLFLTWFLWGGFLGKK